MIIIFQIHLIFEIDCKKTMIKLIQKSEETHKIISVAIEEDDEDVEETKYSLECKICIGFMLLVIVLTIIFYLVMVSLPVKYSTELKNVFHHSQNNIWYHKDIKSSKIRIYPDPIVNRPSGITKDQKQNAVTLKKCFQEPAQCSNVYDRERVLREESYQTDKYNELPFCIVIPTYNNVENNRYITNIDSILMQNYSNYRVIAIDDCSEDKTGQYLKKYVDGKYGQSSNRVTIQINEKRKMALPNIYYAAKQFCKPYEIFIIVDGDDYLLGKQVFKIYNAMYQKTDSWVIFSNFIKTTGDVGYSREYTPEICQKNIFRNVYFGISHLRSFYTKLFYLIKEKDLRDDAQRWLRAANDVAMYIPILEMSCQKVYYIPELVYVYNAETSLNNHVSKRGEQLSNQKHIRARNKYNRIQSLFTEQELNQQKQAIVQVI